MKQGHSQEIVEPYNLLLLKRVKRVKLIATVLVNQ